MEIIEQNTSEEAFSKNDYKELNLRPIVKWGRKMKKLEKI